MMARAGPHTFDEDNPDKSPKGSVAVGAPYSQVAPPEVFIN